MWKLLGIAMGLMSLLAACGGATLRTQTFTSNTTWVAPASVSLLEVVTGQGGTGTPEYYETEGTYYDTYRQVTYNYDPGYGTDSQTPWEYLGTTYDSPQPSDFCNGSYSPGAHLETVTCYDYIGGTYGGTTPATTGGTTTGFGKTFAGGVAGPATPATYNNVAVTPGASYSLVIPSGCSITISYYE